MEITSSTPPPVSQNTTAANNATKNNTAQNAKGSQTANAPNQMETPAPPPPVKKSSDNLKIRNPQLDLDVHYSIGSSGSSDRVTISAKAKEINSIKSAVAKLPDVRDKKIINRQDYYDEGEEEEPIASTTAAPSPTTNRVMNEL